MRGRVHLSPTNSKMNTFFASVEVAQMLSTNRGRLLPTRHTYVLQIIYKYLQI